MLRVRALRRRVSGSVEVMTDLMWIAVSLFALGLCLYAAGDDE